MTQEERQKLDALILEATKHERAFLESEGDGVMNENGAYCYLSQDKSHMLAMDAYLASYKIWLIEKGIVKETQQQ